MTFTRRLALLAALAASAVGPAALSDMRPIDDAPRTISTFRPSAHGFAFRNNFQDRPFSLGWADRFLPWPEHYGLCGGMSLAAADHFLADVPMPSETASPGLDSPWFRYLWQRQVESMGFLGWRALRFAQWMALPDDSARGTFRRTHAHWPTTQARLDAGSPAPIGLVYTSFREGGLLWQNHQVLATSWSADAAGVIDIAIYDPNFPRRDDVTIRLTPVVVERLPGATPEAPLVEILGYSGERLVPGLRPRRVRGMFAMGYKPRTPPQ